MKHHRRRLPGHHCAFTLIELLVVIGIIAVLLSIILPTMGRVRRQAESIKCMSNLRHIGQAMVMYCTDNGGYFPRAAGNGAQYDDYIYWDAGRAAIRDRGALVKYMGGKPFNPSHFQCPSDDLDTHPGYPFSYTMNENMGGIINPPATHPTLHVRIRVRDVKNPSDKILVVDESSATVDDGSWVPAHYALDGQNILSNRHDRDAENKGDPNYGFGNAVFADGHASIVPRASSVNPMFYDPTK